MTTKNLTLAVLSLTAHEIVNGQNLAQKIEVDKSAPVLVNQSVRINAAPEVVWSVLSTINEWDKWQTEIKKPELKGELKPKTIFSWTSGGLRIHSQLETVEDSRVLTWTGKAAGISAIHHWELTERDGQTIATVKESMKGLLPVLFKRALNKSLERGLAKWLVLLKGESEKRQITIGNTPI